ncbi:peptidylprolyl isomerase [Virgisporangium ochraceum]|uniref:Peptidyl-prolyl cis-trans isomerase n=1 Tax=Virgisporangium ochraceum TaxID=65505 RepID=A0A8J4A337_9ACTN|nr:peptidylprolyl isomerase [Virgisporangium ochraceum]GIJ74236.1 peptidyl-prolyl cis-trans isomerase (rotamase) [Virgisporangium ochraceum]
MARTRDRQRALARAKLDRQIARRAAAARRKRQIQAGTAAGLALVLIVLGALWFGGVFEGDKDPAPQGSGQCAWNENTGGQNVKDVGRPPNDDLPTTGIETMTITTNQGVIKAAIDVSKVPCTAASFSFLSGKGYFDNTPCHRLTTDGGGFVLQCGDPSGSGSGGPGYRFADENLPTATTPPSTDPSASASPPAAPALYKRGMIAMANSGEDTNGSQFFIVYKDSPAFEAKYTVLGNITEGLEVVDKIAESGVAEGSEKPGDGKPKVEVTIQKLTLGSGDAPAETPSGQPSGSSSASTQ